MSTTDRVKLDGMAFGIGIGRGFAMTSDVFAVEANPKIAFIPGSKPYFLGFFRYANHLVPCFDLLNFCGFPSVSEQDNQCLISRTVSGDLAAVWVHDITGVNEKTLAQGRVGQGGDIPKPIAPYVANTCTLDNLPHHLIDLQKLVTDLTSDAVTLY